MIKKLEILALALLFAAIGLSVAYWSDLKIASVDLEWFGQRQDDIASYGMNKCREEIWDIKWMYNCQNFILTINAENGGRNMNAKPKNNNWTTDNWLCQLNSAYHSDFINSEEFKDPYKQMDYCLWVRKDAKRKKSMPWYAYPYRYERAKGKNAVHFITPPLSDNITEPKFKVNIKVSKRCTQIATIQKWHYIQFDNKFGQFLYRIKDLAVGTKAFDCQDL